MVGRRTQAATDSVGSLSKRLLGGDAWATLLVGRGRHALSRSECASCGVLRLLRRGRGVNPLRTPRCLPRAMPRSMRKSSPRRAARTRRSRPTSPRRCARASRGRASSSTSFRAGTTQSAHATISQAASTGAAFARAPRRADESDSGTVATGRARARWRGCWSHARKRLRPTSHPGVCQFGPGCCFGRSSSCGGATHGGWRMHHRHVPKETRRRRVPAVARDMDGRDFRRNGFFFVRAHLDAPGWRRSDREGLRKSPRLVPGRAGCRGWFQCQGLIDPRREA